MKPDVFCAGSLRTANRFCVRIDADDLGGGEGLGERDADAARAAADIERAPARLEAFARLGQRLQPVIGKALLVLPAVDEIERVDAIGPELDALDLINR